MYGQVHISIRSLVMERFGEEKWKEILEKLEWNDFDNFLTFEHYSDTVTFSLVGTACQVIGYSLETMLELFGEYFLIYCLEHGYDKMLRTLGDDLKAFIQNLDSLHSLLALSYKKIVAPSFRCESNADGSLTLHYYSQREGLQNMVIGNIRAVGKYIYNQKVDTKVLEIKKENIGNKGILNHVIFRVTLLGPREMGYSDEAAEVDMNHRMLGTENIIDVSTFCSIFPFHVLFDSDLAVHQCGSKVMRWTQLKAISTGTRVHLDDVFRVVAPKMPLTFENIRTFCNAAFILEPIESQHTTDSKTSTQRQAKLILKGSMVFLPAKNQVLFLGSPWLASLTEMEEKNLFLSDIPLYDATRELVLLNQQRFAELGVSKKLDETTAELRRTGLALEQEKAKTDFLLYKMLPEKVATDLKNGINIEAESFASCTILFSDIVTFTNIAAAVQPIQIVQMLNELYMRFDRLTELHNVYKVETIGDAYMIVGGVPVRSDVHAHRVCDFSLDMVTEASQVMSPATGHPLQIRIGVHTGSVVAGVVGEKMPRYCLFGDTVNTASRMESHGLPGRIHLSPHTHEVLISTSDEYITESRGEIQVKGKGLMHTHFLIGNASTILQPPPKPSTATQPSDDKPLPELSAKIIEQQPLTLGSCQPVNRDKSVKTQRSTLCIIS